MKIASQLSDSPNGIQAWVHEDFVDQRYSAHSTDTKSTTMDIFDTFFLRESPQSTSSLAELKPLEPLDYITSSTDTSGGRHQLSPSTSSTPTSYLPSINHSGSFLAYSSNPEPVSTTPSIKQEPVTTYGLNQPDLDDDFASLIGSAMADNIINPSINSIIMSDPLDHISTSDLNLDDWINTVPADSMIDSTMSANELSSSGPQPSLTSTQQPSTTANGLSQYSSQTQIQTPSSTPMLQSLLASGTHLNNNYIQGLASELSYKQELPMSILHSRLTQGGKEANSLSNVVQSTGGILKADILFSRPQYFNKDSIPHSTDPTTFAVTTTDDILIGKYDCQTFLDKTQLDSPESTDLSSTKIGLDYSDIKSKNRSRMNKNAKLPIRTEGTKDKPIHHCTVCNRGFLNKSNIKVHLRTHTGEKPFKCETCNKAFRQKAHLLKHYQIHKRGVRD